MQRLDYTRTGRWRLVAAFDLQDPEHPWPPQGRSAPSGAAHFISAAARQTPDACPTSRGFEVEELGFEKWAEIAPLFQRSDRVAG